MCEWPTFIDRLISARCRKSSRDASSGNSEISTDFVFIIREILNNVFNDICIKRSRIKYYIILEMYIILIYYIRNLI